MTTSYFHAQRIEKDLALLRYAFEASKGVDSNLDTALLHITSLMTAELARCQKRELTYLDPDQLNEGIVRPMVEQFAKASGRNDLPDCEFRPPRSQEAEAQEASLVDLRKMLAVIIEFDDFSGRCVASLRSNVAAIIRGERQLQTIYVRDGVYKDADGCNRFAEEVGDRLTEWARQLENEDWSRIVDEVIGSDG